MPEYRPADCEDAGQDEKADDHASHQEPIETLNDVDTPSNPWLLEFIASGEVDLRHELVLQLLWQPIEPESQRVGAGVVEGVEEYVGANGRVEIDGTRSVMIALIFDFQGRWV